MSYYGKQIEQKMRIIKVLFNQFLCATLPRKVGLKIIENCKRGGVSTSLPIHWSVAERSLCYA